MSILVDNNTKLVVQGITGDEGSFHTQQMIEYGTKVVAGVTPGKAGQKVDTVPVFHSRSLGKSNHGASPRSGTSRSRGVWSTGSTALISSPAVAPSSLNLRAEIRTRRSSEPVARL